LFPGTFGFVVISASGHINLQGNTPDGRTEDSEVLRKLG
jgi:hypothetical protein